MGILRLDDYYVKVLTLKEPSAQSFPLIFKNLLEVQANFHIVTEWKKEDSGKARKTIQSKRRHFHNTKRSLMSHLNVSDAPPTDVLVDDSKEAQVRELGASIKELEIEGNYFGQFSLSVVIYDLDPAKVDTACADFYKVFSVHDAQLYEEKYNLLNAFLGDACRAAPLSISVPCICSTRIMRTTRFSSPSTVASLRIGICGRNISQFSKPTTTLRTS